MIKLKICKNFLTNTPWIDLPPHSEVIEIFVIPNDEVKIRMELVSEKVFERFKNSTIDIMALPTFYTIFHKKNWKVSIFMIPHFKEYLKFRIIYTGELKCNDN